MVSDGRLSDHDLSALAPCGIERLAKHSEDVVSVLGPLGERLPFEHDFACIGSAREPAFLQISAVAPY
jgi:hypothetical protein